MKWTSVRRWRPQLNVLVSQNPSAYSPFHTARVEGFGTGAGRRKRKDLRFYDDYGNLVLCGEVKLPGTPEGRSPYDQKLCEDAEAKASNAGVRYFFTWNVNQFVLWDRSLWDRPLLERRVWDRATRPDPGQPGGCCPRRQPQLHQDAFPARPAARPGRHRFRPPGDEWLPPDDIFIHSLESHLDWPVQLASAYILEQADKNKPFDLRIQRWMTDQDWTFVRTPHEEWVKAVDNMAKTLAYVWANRLIFYKALRARFPDLPRLELRRSVKKPDDAVAALQPCCSRRRSSEAATMSRC